MFKSPPGQTVFVDIDDTLIQWKEPNDDTTNEEIITVTCRGVTEDFALNVHNVNYVRKMGVRGHAIVFWSKAGSCWAEAVAIALGMNDIVCACLAKPDYYIDDIQDPKEFMGKWVFHDIKGKRQGFMSKEHNKEEDK